MKWIKPEDVNWQDVYETERPVLVYGKANDFYDVFVADYASGIVLSFEDDIVNIYSDLQGEQEFRIKDIIAVVLVSDPEQECNP